MKNPIQVTPSAREGAGNILKAAKVFGIIAVSVPCLSANAASGTNLLANPGFEDGKADWLYFDTGQAGSQGFWNLGAATAPVRSGHGSFKEFGGDFNSNSTNYGGIFQVCPSCPGAIYSADAWAHSLANDRIGPANLAYVEVQFLNSSKHLCGLWRSAAFSSTWAANTWFHLAVTNRYDCARPNSFTPTGTDARITAPAGTAHVSFRLVFMQDKSNGGAVYWDDASLVQTGGPTPPALAPVSLAGKSAEECLALARQLRDQQRNAEAAKAFEQAVTLQPGNEAALTEQFRFYAENNQPTNAMKVLDKLIALNPNDTERWLRKGMFAAEADQVEEAVKAFDKLTELQPKEAIGWIGKGQLLLGMNRNEDALKALTQAVTVGPSSVDAWQFKARAEYELKQYDAAIASMSKAIAIMPDHADFVYGRAVVYAVKGNKANALADLKRAIQLKPSCKDEALKEEKLKPLANDPEFKKLTQ